MDWFGKTAEERKNLGRRLAEIEARANATHAIAFCLLRMMTIEQRLAISLELQKFLASADRIRNPQSVPDDYAKSTVRNLGVSFRRTLLQGVTTLRNRKTLPGFERVGVATGLKGELLGYAYGEGGRICRTRCGVRSHGEARQNPP